MAPTMPQNSTTGMNLHSTQFPREVARTADGKTGSVRRWFLRGIVGLTGVTICAGTATLLLYTLTPQQSNRQLTHMVRRGELVISVTQSGEVQSGSNKDIKCLVEGGSTILWIIEDGSQVKQGDELVRLDASKIEDGISQQKIAYEKARAAHIQAESDRVVAELAVTEYLEGTFRAALQLAQSNIAIAEENLRSANNRLEYTERMFRKGYVGAVERDAQRFAVEHAALELDLKRTEEDVLSRFTKPKTLEELRSKFKAADAKMLSEAAALDLEATRLARLEAQKDGCVIRAPDDGMAIYPQVPRWSQQPEVKEGAVVRENQTLIQLPNLTQMQVKVNVHESKVEQLKPGMKARIRIQDRDWSGEVVSIANRAEQAGWWSGSAKEFATIVKIDDQLGRTPEGQLGLKPGMSAEVEIMVAKHDDILTLPVAAVVEQQGSFFCWSRVAGDVEIRPLVLGPSNDQFIVVKDGVKDGEEVVLNPRAVVEEARQRELEPRRETLASEVSSESSSGKAARSDESTAEKSKTRAKEAVPAT